MNQEMMAAPLLRPIITEKGLAAANQAATLGKPVVISHVTLSDVPGEASYTDETLVGQGELLTVADGRVVSPTQVNISALVPDTYPTTDVCGLAFYLNDGTLFAIYRELTPILYHKTGETLLLGLDFVMSNIPSDSVIVESTGANLVFGDWVPEIRRINGKQLKTDISLTPEDVGAVSKKGDKMAGQLTLANAPYAAVVEDGSTIAFRYGSSTHYHATAGKNGEFEIRTGDGVTGPVALSIDYTGLLTTLQQGKLYGDKRKPTPSEIGTYTSKEIDDKDATKVPNTRRVNGKQLTGDVNLGPADVGSAPASHGHSDLVPKATKVNGKPLTGDITLTPEDIGVKDQDLSGLVPKTTKVNGYSLTGDVNLSADDVGASSGELPLPDVWAPLSNDLSLITGCGRQIKVGGHVIGNLVSFERSTTATYIDKSGVLRVAGINEPRFEKEGLLIEGKSTNLCVRPDFTTWGPTGGSTEKIDDYFYKYKEDASSGAHNLGGATVIVASGKTYTFSVLVKPSDVGEKRFAALTVGGSTVTASHRVTFDLVDGSFVESNHPVKGASKKVGDYWLCSMTFDAIGDGNLTVAARSSDKTPNTLHAWQGDGVSGFIIGCPQVEELPFATSYIPTNGAAVTRDADKCWIGAELNAPQDQFSIAAEVSTRNTSEDKVVYSYDFYNRVTIRGSVVGMATGAPGSYKPSTVDGFIAGASNVVAGKKLPDGTAIPFCNGVKSQNAIPWETKARASQTLRIGCLYNGGEKNHLFGHVRNFRIWHKVLTDNQMRSIA